MGFIFSGELFGDEDIGELVTGVAVPIEFCVRFSADVSLSPFKVFDEAELDLFVERSVVEASVALLLDTYESLVVVVVVVVVVNGLVKFELAEVVVVD